MRRYGWHTAALSATIVLTAPLFALLCRGHAPSRFAVSNLPFWQRALPHPAPLAVALCSPPAAPGTVHYDAPFLQNVNEDQLLAGLERPSSRAAKSGAAGEWLEKACALGRNNAHLRRLQDEVALRLMNTQDQDGYLAMGKGRLRWSPAQADAFGHNLRGLLAFYAVTHDPAAIYAAMQAGDLVVSEFASSVKRPKLPVGLLLPMTRLYLATGEPRYRAWVQTAALETKTDGTGLCAVYALTGQARFLHLAERLQQHEAVTGNDDVELSAALWAVSGKPKYLEAEDPAQAPWICPLLEGVLTYSRTPHSLSVNVFVNSSVTLGPMRLTQRVTTLTGKRTATVTVRAPRRAPFTLRLFVPPGSGAARVMTPDTTQAVTVPRGRFWELTRAWKKGDTVTLTYPAAPPTIKPIARS